MVVVNKYINFVSWGLSYEVGNIFEFVCGEFFCKMYFWFIKVFVRFYRFNIN